MDFSSIKLPITVMAIVIAQAFGLIWYAAQLDSTVSTLSVTVSELKASMTDTSIAVIENDLAYLKEKVTALGTPVEFDDSDLWYTIDQLEIPDFTDADAQELYTKIDKIEIVQTDLQNNLSVLETTVNYLQDRLDDVEVKAEANELMEVNAYLELRAELVAYLDSIEAELQELAISVAVIEAVMESDFNKTLKNGGLSKVYNELKLDAESPEVLP
jgi:hypothetical protein